MQLTVISTQGVVVSQEVDMVSLPGVAGRFTVLKDHAPIISALEKGVVEYGIGSARETLEIGGGVAEVKHNKVRILIE